MRAGTRTRASTITAINGSDVTTAFTVSDVDVLTVGGLAEIDTKILRTAVLKGMLGHVSDESVNYVNADYYAEQRGLKVTETKRTETHDYVNMIIVRASHAGDEPVEAAAALVGKKNEPRLVSLFGYDLDMTPGGAMAFFRSEDVPGVIGKVGTILGDSRINIATMQVGRTTKGGQALMGVNVDSPLGPELLDRIVAEVGMDDAWSVEL